MIGGGGALLGFAPREIAIYGALALAVQLVAHANSVATAAPLAEFLAPVLVTPDFHRLHHSQMRIQADANYGQIFSFWDKLFASRQHGQVSVIEFGVEGCHAAPARNSTAPSCSTVAASLRLNAVVCSVALAAVHRGFTRIV